jgi:Raf kinase inhibitor-like YbhB/YbcL family protein
MLVRRNTYLAVLLLCLANALWPAGCGPEEMPPVETTISLSSTAFEDGGAIPDGYTCEGDDISPPLYWGVPPAGTRSIALIVDDLDTSARFTHWIIFNIPADIRELPEALSAGSGLPDGSIEGKNDFGRNYYSGPCPPSGKAHRYRFTVYALDNILSLEPGASKGQVFNVMQGHVLAQGQLIGTYQR